MIRIGSMELKTEVKEKMRFGNRIGKSVLFFVLLFAAILSLHGNVLAGTPHMKKVGNDTVYIDASGKIVQNKWVKYRDNWYYAGDRGVIRKNAIIAKAGKKRYVNAGGKMVTSSDLLVKGYLYHADQDGVLTIRKKWVKIGNNWFYGDANGKILKSSLVKSLGKLYYVNAKGRMIKNSNVLAKDKLYHADADGVLTVRKRWVEVNGRWYFGGTDGTIYKNRAVSSGGDLFYLNASGVMITSGKAVCGTKLYKAGKSGKLSLTSGWAKISGKWYCAKSDGSLLRNVMKDISGKKYAFDSKGVMYASRLWTLDGKLRYSNAGGVVRQKSGWLKVSGKWYYSDSDGVFYRNCSVTVDGERYYMDSTGAWIGKKPTIDQYLGAKNLYKWEKDHFNNYYFITPYKFLWGNETHPERLIQPYGLYGNDGGMNCTGFISSLISSSGGDLSKVSAMGGYGGYANAANYWRLAQNGLVEYYTFSSVSELLRSGKAKKGDIMYLEPDWSRPGADCHMGVFWGDSSSDDKLWSMTLATKCTVTNIKMVDPVERVYLFPITH